MPESLGKLVKRLGVPVVTLIAYGHHINAPFWNQKTRMVRTKATMTRIITREEACTLPVEQINRIINQAFEYDDFAWKRENKIPVLYKDRASGLHKVLYQCPDCRTEHRMRSGGPVFW